MSYSEKDHLRRLTLIQARIVIPPLLLGLAAVGVLVIAEFNRWSQWLTVAAVIPLFVATIANWILAANARCPKCGGMFFRRGKTWNLFRFTCSHCGFGPPSPDRVAVAAGYLGLVSVLIFPAPLALAVSLASMNRARKNPDYVGRRRSMFGLVMGLLGTSVFVLILLIGLWRHFVLALA